MCPFIKQLFFFPKGILVGLFFEKIVLISQKWTSKYDTWHVDNFCGWKFAQNGSKFLFLGLFIPKSRFFRDWHGYPGPGTTPKYPGPGTSSGTREPGLSPGPADTPKFNLSVPKQTKQTKHSQKKERGKKCYTQMFEFRQRKGLSVP